MSKKKNSPTKGMPYAAGSASDQTAGLDTVLRGRSESGAKETKQAVESALASAQAGADLDPRLVQLFKDFKLYRVLVVAIVAIGFAMLLLAIWLYTNGQIDEETQNNILLIANVVIVVGMVVAFGRARPIKEDINAWHKVNELALRESDGKHGATQADIDKIFLSRARNKRVPPTAEFKAIRRVWLGLIATATIITLVAVIIAQRNMADVTIPVVMIIVSFALLIVATVIERLKMKPLREAWERELKEKVKQATKRSKKNTKGRR